MIVYRELDGPLRAWLRRQAPLTDLCGEHIYFEAPDISRRMTATDPQPRAWLEFRRIGGGPEADQDARLDDALVTFDCCGRTRREAAVLSQRLVNTLGQVRWPVALEDGFELLHAQVTLWRWQPDAQVARYVVDMALMLRSWAQAVPPSGPDYPTLVLADGAIFYWRLNEPLGSTAVDSSAPETAQGIVGVNVALGSPSVLPCMPQETSAEFSGRVGPDELIAVVLPAVLTGPAQSLEWWCEIVNDDEFEFMHLSAVPDTFGRWNGDGHNYGACFETVRHNHLAPIPTSGLHHFVVTRQDGGEYRLYQDGALIGSAAAGALGFDGAMLIGGRDGMGFRGRIGQVAIYPFEMTAAMVAAHYQLGNTPP